MRYAQHGQVASQLALAPQRDARPEVRELDHGERLDAAEVADAHHRHRRRQAREVAQRHRAAEAGDVQHGDVRAQSREGAERDRAAEGRVPQHRRGLLYIYFFIF